MSIITSTLYYH